MPSLATENIILRDVGVGDIRTVLTEDVILKSMKQRKHMLIMGVILARKVAREAGGKVGLAGNGRVSREEGIMVVIRVTKITRFTVTHLDLWGGVKGCVITKPLHKVDATNDMWPHDLNSILGEQALVLLQVDMPRGYD
ncbi:hypothetical protein Tco_0558800 [Tanacetum coccineum]